METRPLQITQKLQKPCLAIRITVGSTDCWAIASDGGSVADVLGEKSSDFACPATNGSQALDGFRIGIKPKFSICGASEILLEI